MIEQRARRGTRLNFNLQRYIGSASEDGDEDGDDSGEHEPSSSPIGIEGGITKEEFESLAKDRLDSDCGSKPQQIFKTAKQGHEETKHSKIQQQEDFHHKKTEYRRPDTSLSQTNEQKEFHTQKNEQLNEKKSQPQQQQQHPNPSLQEIIPARFKLPQLTPQKSNQSPSSQTEHHHQQEMNQLQLKRQQEVHKQQQIKLQQEQELRQRQLQIQQKQQQELHQQRMRQRQLELQQQQLKQQQEQMLFEQKRLENERQERLLRQKLEQQHIQDDLVHHRPHPQVTNSYHAPEAISQRSPSSRVQLPPPQESAKISPTKESSAALPRTSKRDHRTVLSISGKKRCSSCKEELGRGAAAFVVESLNLVEHTVWFGGSVCHVNLADGFRGVDVRVHEEALHCQNCYSKDGLVYSRV